MYNINILINSGNHPYAKTPQHFRPMKTTNFKKLIARSDFCRMKLLHLTREWCCFLIYCELGHLHMVIFNLTTCPTSKNLISE